MKACFTGGVSSIEQAKTAVWGQGSLVWHASKLALVGKPRGQGANKMKKSIQKNFKRIIRMFLHNDACRNFAYVNPCLGDFRNDLATGWAFAEAVEDTRRLYVKRAAPGAGCP